VLQVAPSSYYDYKSRPPSRRKLRDGELKKEILRVHGENFDAYGAEKMWRQLHREAISCGRDRVARLMRELGLCGITRRKSPRTTTAAKDAAALPGDHVKRNFKADEVNKLWVNDLTYVAISSGFAYTSFVSDACSKRIVGWKVSSSLSVEVALDALEMAIWTRRNEGLDGLVHHSDRGSQYTSIRYSARLEEAGIVPSVGSKGDSYDNALAETINGLYKAELIRRRSSWQSVAEVERATAEWVAWWNHRRIHSAIGFLAPVEYEAALASQRAARPAREAA
jgi:putative transposase